MKVRVALCLQPGFGRSPLRVEPFLKVVKCTAVIVFSQVTDFMRHHVVNTIGRRFDQVRVQRNHSAG